MDPVYVTQTTIAVTILHKIHYCIEVPKAKKNGLFSGFQNIIGFFIITLWVWRQTHVRGLIEYGRKVSWIVKRYEKYGRNPSWRVKSLEKRQVEEWNDMENMEDFCFSHNYTQREILLLLLPLYIVFQNWEESSWNSFLLETASRDQIYHFIHLALRNTTVRVLNHMSYTTYID